MAKDPTSKENMTAYQRWELQAFDAPPQSEHNVIAVEQQQVELVPLPTAEDVQRIQQQAYQEGFAAGMKDGRAEGQVVARRMQSMMLELQKSMTDFEELMAQEIMNLSLDIARQMVRSALEADPALVLAVVREAIESLPQILHHPTLVLNPEDAALVREMLTQEFHNQNWRIVEDAHLERGGCRVETGSTEIDANLENRWRRIVSALGSDVPWRK